MLAVASGGLLVNALGLWILRGGHDDNLNMQGAWLYVLTDVSSLYRSPAEGSVWLGALLFPVGRGRQVKRASPFAPVACSGARMSQRRKSSPDEFIAFFEDRRSI
jgi:hypothetical protein